jgi:hypothetical protein
MRTAQQPAMNAAEFEERIVSWAKGQPDLKALVQIGSRAQPDAQVDEWSDWDYHLITTQPQRYLKRDWLEQIAPCWSSHIEGTARGVKKVSAVFSPGMEVDFVPLSAWQMKLVYACMRRPSLRGFFPALLLRGISNTQLVVRPGYRVVLGGEEWERRLDALNVTWPDCELTESEFAFHANAYWRHAVWVAKKIGRGELRAAMRWHHLEATEHVWILLAEEARIAGRPARPEARKAEQWLDGRRLEQTNLVTSLDQKVLARALRAQIELFEEVSRSVAQSRGFKLPDHSAVAAWLRTELDRLELRS